MNKKQRGFWERYLRSVQNCGLRRIEDCYSRPSQAKKEAYRQIVAFNPGARFMTVVVAGCHTFSVGWLQCDKDNNWYFEYETVCKHYSVQLDNDMKADAVAHGVCPWKK